jgi:hypothetical protein
MFPKLEYSVNYTVEQIQHLISERPVLQAEQAIPGELECNKKSRAYFARNY